MYIDSVSVPSQLTTDIQALERRRQLLEPQSGVPRAALLGVPGDAGRHAVQGKILQLGETAQVEQAAGCHLRTVCKHTDNTNTVR